MQTLAIEPLTRPFVNMKDAVQEVLKRGLSDYRKVGVIDWKVKVVKSDPKVPVDLPAIAISRSSDSEINQALGDVFGEIRDRDIDAVVKKFGTDFREVLEIRIWTINSDQRDMLYSLTKRILFDYRHFLALKYGLVNQAMTGGRDEANHTRYEPHFLYWGVVMFSAENAIQRNIIVPAISAVESELTARSGSGTGDDFSQVAVNLQDI